MFIKTAHIVASDFFSNPNDLKQLNWNDVVRSGRNFDSPFIDSFEWDPDRFLYYRCRAITADVPNLNGDLFPDSELSKSFNTFIGKGVYYNHDSNHPDKAFGIILDASYHQYPDDRYVQILGAIDKQDIEKKRPNLLNRIKSGSLNTTSMSVAVQKCVCSVCGNVATSVENLCDHMNPKSVSYVKGRTYRGLKAHEINYGLNFLEDSLVETPADSTAYVFQIYSSIDTPKSSILLNHFNKYASFKENLQKQSDKVSEDLEKVVDDTIDKKIKNKVLQLVDEKVRTKIDPILQTIEDKTKTVIDNVVDTVMKEKETNIGLESIQLKDVKKESEPKSQEIKKPITPSDKVPATEKKPIEKSKEMSPKVEQPILQKSFKMVNAESVVEIDKNKSLELLDKLFKETEDSKNKLKQMAETLDFGDGLVFNKVDSKHYVAFKDGVNTDIKIEVSVDFYKKNLNDQKEEILQKFNLIKDSIEKSKHKEVKYSMNIIYEKGVDFANSFFVISDSDKQFKVSASEIIPKDVQQKILNNDENIAGSEEIVEQMKELSAGKYDVLTNEVIPQLKKACEEQNAVLENKPVEQTKSETSQETEVKSSSKIEKKAEFAWAEDEIPSKKVVKPEEGPVMAMNTEEGIKPEVGASQPSKVKQYYSKLPSKAVDEPITSINVQSSKDVSNLEIKTKLDLLKKALEEEKSKNIELSKELSVEKEKGEKRDKTESINKVMDLMSDLFDIEESDKSKVVELLNKFAPIQLNLVKQLVELLGSKQGEKNIEDIAKKTLDKNMEPSLGPVGKSPSKSPVPPVTKKEAAQLPQIFLNTQENDYDMIDIAVKSLMK